MDNDHLNLYFREIIYNNPSSKKDSVCGVFSYEALNIEEAKLGNLYLVGKISGFSSKKHKNFDFLFNLLISVIKREFYSDPQRGTLEALESALQSANIYLTDFSKKGHKEWIGNIDFTCMAFSNNDIHIGQTGNTLIYLLRGDTMSNVSRKFSNNIKSSNPSKTFSNIVSGDLEEGDKMIISTPNLLEIIPQQKIKELISQPSTKQIYEFLKEKLEGISKSKDKIINSLASLILESRTRAPIIEKEPPQIVEIKKIIGLDLERIINSKSNKFNNVVKNKIPSSSKLSHLIPLLKYHIPKHLIVLFLFFLMILSPYIIQKAGYDLRLKQVNNIIKRVNETISRSEISLAYQNQFEAKSLIQQSNSLIANASSLLSSLPDLVKAETIENLNLIKEELSGQRNSINNIINIEQPEELADLSKNTFSFNPHGILGIENSLFLYELASGFLYKINLDDINNPVLIFLSSKDTFKLGTVKENSLVLLSNPEKIYLYNQDDSYNTYLVKPDFENTLHIKDVDIYGESFYFLNTEKLDILKYVQEANSFIGNSWMNENFKEDLTNAVSLAVDGSIYVSKENGLIFEFTQGKKVQEIKLEISPEITKGSQLFTTQEMKHLYVLDPENKRIIAFNKNDETSTQYVSSEFNSLTDLWVSADETTIFILNGSKIFRINI